MEPTDSGETPDLETLDMQDLAGAVLDRPVGQRFVLDAVEGPARGASHTSLGGRVSVGSHPSNDFVIEDRTVSRFHCEVWLDVQGGRIRDSESLNGTRVDGIEVLDARLREGSLLRIGDTVLRFTVASERAPLPVSNARQFGQLVGSSIPMRAAFYRLERAAASEATVLIEGETGTGKDAAAEAIHLQSERREGPFVVFDCSAVAADLIESELFGHEKGAFTGATAERVGAFEAAAGGTAFLDELGELPADLQPKLLRVLEQRTVQHVGGNQRIPVDVRVIAATNRDLRAAVNTGTFRSDLYFRLAVLKVRMPSLRERPEDLPELVHCLLSSLGANAEQARTVLDKEFLARLKGASWPGNVRELRNYVEQTLVLLDAPPLHDDSPARPGAPVDLSVPFQVAKRAVLEEFERRYLSALLRSTHGNVAEAARAASVERKYLHRLRRKLGV